MPAQNIEKITIETAQSPSDLMVFIEKIAAGGEYNEFTSGFPASWAFRGQPKTYGTLAPSFQRVFHENRSVPAALLIESTLIDAFRKHYEKLQGISKDMPDPTKIRDGMDLHCLTVMQHYGVPTRLLDWTSDFWTAVYFACAGYPDEDAELWFYDRNLFINQDSWLGGMGSLRTNSLITWEPQVLSLRDMSLLFEFDPQLTPRMKQQQAHHTFSTQIFEDHVPLFFRLADEQQSQDQKAPGLRRIVISKGCKEKTLRFLDEYHDMNASKIFPDVEGLGKFLNWQLETLLTTIL